MEKLANAVAESFMEKYPNVTVTAEFTGSSAGIESVLAGSVDIGNSSRNLKDDEKSAGAAENIVAIDGIAVVADPANKVEDLTKDQLVSIYTGETKNWSEVGGDDQAIVVVGREASGSPQSERRAFFGFGQTLCFVHDGIGHIILAALIRLPDEVIMEVQHLLLVLLGALEAEDAVGCHFEHRKSKLQRGGSGGM